MGRTALGFRQSRVYRLFENRVGLGPGHVLAVDEERRSATNAYLSPLLHVAVDQALGSVRVEGGFESLALPFDIAPVRSKMAWPKEGWGVEDRCGIRLSIGLEDAGDLIADLEQAFAAMDQD